MRYTRVSSPLDALLLTSDGEALTGLYMTEHRYGPALGPDWVADDSLPLFQRARDQLEEYFAGRLRRFDLPLAPRGTAFQRSVWRALTTIPYGATTTYGALAARLGRPSASRAVGMANGRNPISVVVPCHRVVGSNGALTGFGGGLPRKARLLGLESEGIAAPS
ncbi:methylated-DNA--[protein]-cysteine S-methyltransferase [Streptomyces sp. NPDC005438]|uniref:methylated-DNA--[protein]-cysteine S-methyltransferase n=1 Tax=Streptomyces sp. NPDC005438 TaxID=3156880 RepID=UPI0033A20811